MKFTTVEDIVTFLKANTDYIAVPKDILKKLNEDSKIPKIFTADGKKYLQKNGFIKPQYVWHRVGFIFNNFKCEGCTIEKSVCPKCRALRVIINSL